MSARLQVISFRGRVALVFCFLVIILQFVLNRIGLAHYYYEMGPNHDRSIGDRVCLVFDWMLLACLFVWASSEFRIRQAVLFPEGGGSALPLLTGCVGLLLLIGATAHLVRIPLSGVAFGFMDGWVFGIGWLLLWWGLVFRR